jgi:hypothetical protein
VVSCGVISYECSGLFVWRKFESHAFWMSGFWQSLGHILFWLGVRNALSNSLIDHIWQFCGLANHAKFEKGIFNIIWLARSWSIWKERNSCLFQQKAISRESLVAFGYGLFQNALILSLENTSSSMLLIFHICTLCCWTIFILLCFISISCAGLSLCSSIFIYILLFSF